MNNHGPCESCKGTGLWSMTYEDDLDPCRVCDGTGEDDNDD